MELSPFTVNASNDQGYLATSSLAGTRLRTDLKDVGASISVLTKEFLDDIGATDAESALSYATNMEISGTRGNYLGASSSGFGNNNETTQMLNPSQSTRVRGLVSADNTRNYFRTNVGWDGYNVGRIDLLRGPNSILFGLGSPGGVVNASTDAANLRRDSGELGVVIDQFGSLRGTFQFNKVIAKGQLAIRGALLSEETKYRQSYTFQDQNRQFVATTYKPLFLNRPGTSFEISVDYEKGNTRSNRPRHAPPVDSFSPYVTGMTINEIQLPVGSNFEGYANGVIPGSTYSLPGYQVPLAGNFGGTLPDGVSTSFDGNGIRYTDASDGTISPFWAIGRGGAYGVFNSNGSINTNPFSAALFGANATSKYLGSMSNYASAIGHPFASAFTPTSLTDSSIFDFYNVLIDGPNKREWSNFDQLRLVLSNTFFSQKLGYEVSHYQESSELGQTTLMSDNNRILVDINQFTNDGQPNPNVGRAYVQETTYAGNRTRFADLEATRISAFLDYDFKKEGNGPSWLSRTLGRQVINAVWSKDESDSVRRDFARHVYPDDLLTEGTGRPNQRFNNNTRTSIQYYISDDLTGFTDLAGVNFSAITTPILDTIGQAPITVRVFDPTWIADPSVAKNALWVNPLGANSTQSANPANYVGWTNKQYNLIDALSGNQADLDLATRSAILDYSKVESKILSWQGYLFDGALVGTFGWREDTSTSVQTRSSGRPDGGANLDPAVFNLDNGNSFELVTRSKNYSAVAHLNRLPLLNHLPLNVSLTYNQGENFNPTAGRVNKLGQPLSPPQGSTKEYGVLLSTADNRYVLKVTKYETVVLNDSTGAIRNEFQVQQLLGNNGAVSAFEAATGLLRAEYEARSTTPSWSIDDQEKISAPAWYAMESALKTQFPGFISSWLTASNGGTFAPSNDKTVFAIAGTNTADTVSEGYEVEFTANPTPELRLTFNASKTVAASDNVPGAGTQAIYEFLDQALWKPDGTLTAAGALRSTNDPFAADGTLGEFFRNSIWPNYQFILQQNGLRNTELVELRFNALANYTFREGRFKGVGIGSSFRWEGERSVGYPRYFDEFGAAVADLAHPFKAPSSNRVDFTLSYKRKLTERVDWKIQLNVYNALSGNELVPVAANPDGTYSLYRIQGGRSWRISNTFQF